MVRGIWPKIWNFLFFGIFVLNFAALNFPICSEHFEGHWKLAQKKIVDARAKRNILDTKKWKWNKNNETEQGGQNPAIEESENHEAFDRSFQHAFGTREGDTSISGRGRFFFERKKLKLTRQGRRRVVDPTEERQRGLDCYQKAIANLIKFNLIRWIFVEPMA